MVRYTRVESPWLTERDREMLALIADDFGYGQVAQQLGLAVQTVAKRTRVLQERYGVHTQVGLIVRLLHLGILVLDQMPSEYELLPIEQRRLDQAQAAGTDETGTETQPHVHADIAQRKATVTSVNERKDLNDPLASWHVWTQREPRDTP